MCFRMRVHFLVVAGGGRRAAKRFHWSPGLLQLTRSQASLVFYIVVDDVPSSVMLQEGSSVVRKDSQTCGSKSRYYVISPQEHCGLLGKLLFSTFASGTESSSTIDVGKVVL